MDEDLARVAIAEALAEGLGDQTDFDPAAIGAAGVQRAVLAFTTELVFLQVVSDAAKSFTKAASPAEAVRREADIRDLIREVVDVVGTPIVQAAGNVVAQSAMTDLVSRLVNVALSEIEKW